MFRFFSSIVNYETPRDVSRKGGLRRGWWRNFSPSTTFTEQCIISWLQSCSLNVWNAVHHMLGKSGAGRTRFCKRRGKEFRNSRLKNCRGFSLVETLVVLAVASLVTIIVVSVFSNTASRETLNKQKAIAVSLLETARGSTLSAKNASVYGVHFESAKAVLFAGQTYNAADPSNTVEMFSPSTRISQISLAGGGSEVIFNRLTGETQQFGTIQISLVASSTQTKTITVFQTGIIQSN